ncbi:hypothetical protein ILUMI_08580 [Ignelater luminosus]|uniref:Peptidase S1 domain-containing protein n=1 Tax=Ignelater luminosus TaxID=2038154 RepID=A0A8K0D1M7_IGNLU|nr:hypothetical protein ILUMI_08580 [Ignelater luminosus]
MHFIALLIFLVLTKVNYCVLQSTVKPVTTSKLSGYEISCGYQHSDDFFHTVNDTALSEFPWFAQIKEIHKDDNAKTYSYKFFCSGALITVKHVLTAASCITDDKHSQYLREIVRLGEYNILTKTDCVEDSQVYECNEEVRNFGIDEIMPHPDYKIINNIQRINDIGLITMNGSVSYSDYIRPICLRLPDMPRITDGDELVTIRFQRSLTNVKPKLTRKFIAREACQTKFPKYLPFFMHEGHMCGTHLNDTERNCELNNVGSPVMVNRRYKKNPRWFQVGIITGTWENCHLSLPDLYTDVSYYLEWIEKNLEL